MNFLIFGEFLRVATCLWNTLILFILDKCERLFSSYKIFIKSHRFYLKIDITNISVSGCQTVNNKNSIIVQEVLEPYYIHQICSEKADNDNVVT